MQKAKFTFISAFIDFFSILKVIYLNSTAARNRERQKVEIFTDKIKNRYFFVYNGTDIYVRNRLAFSQLFNFFPQHVTIKPLRHCACNCQNKTENF